MTDSPAPINRLRSRAQFLLLAVLFFAPFVSAYLVIALKPDWRPDGQVNYGQLVNPALALPTATLPLRDAEGRPISGNPFGRRWVLLQLLRGPCEAACKRELMLGRQVYATLGARRERVVRALVAVDGADIGAVKATFEAEQPGLLWLQDSASTPRLAGLLAAAPDNALLLLDPVGTWLMVYPNVAADEDSVQKDFKGIQKDLNKLLRLSHIG